MVMMDVGLPHALVRVLYDCVCEDLVIRSSVVTHTTGPGNPHFTLMGKKFWGVDPRVACFYE